MANLAKAGMVSPVVFCIRMSRRSRPKDQGMKMSSPRTQRSRVMLLAWESNRSKMYKPPCVQKMQLNRKLTTHTIRHMSSRLNFSLSFGKRSCRNCRVKSKIANTESTPMQISIPKKSTDHKFAPWSIESKDGKPTNTRSGPL